MGSPLLSIGIIVKDEIRCIERCLQSLQPLREQIPCQLVVADTGSTDGTREVVEKYADIVFDFPWNNDFAAARNAVLDRCTGEWFLSIDADEWLKDAAPFAKLLLDGKQKKYNFVLCTVRSYLNEAHSKFLDGYVARIGQRRDGKLRFHFPIHEVMFFTDNVTGPTTILPDLILYHDGYLNVTPHHLKDKRSRNMVLLRAEVAKHPDDLRLLVHAYQSADDPEERRDYITRALKSALEDTKDPYSSIAFQQGLLFFLTNNEYKKVIENYNCWKELWPNSPILEVDGQAMAAAAENKLEHDESVLAHIQRWREGMHRIQQKRDLDSEDRFVTQYYMDDDDWHGKLNCLEIQSLVHLERYAEANHAIKEIDLAPVEHENRVALLNLVFGNTEHLSSVNMLLKQCWALCIPQEEAEQDEKAKCLVWKKAFFNVAKSWMKKDPEKAVSLLCDLNDCVLGLSAQIIRSIDPDEITGLWAQISDWEDVLPQAYFHTMELGLPFSEVFYHQQSAALQTIAASIANSVPDYASCIAKQNWPEASTLAQQQFQYDLTAAALQQLSSLLEAEEKGLCRTLCNRFVSLAQGLLPKLYHPELVQHPDDWNVLPGMHQFGLWLCAAEQHQKDGDLPGYMRVLRYGLQAAPLMKDMVKFLMEQAEADEKASLVRQAASPELLELAEKVRAILAQYPPDDPSVAALKQSDVYQKVAYLIEDEKTD